VDFTVDKLAAEAEAMEPLLANADFNEVGALFNSREIQVVLIQSVGASNSQVSATLHTCAYDHVCTNFIT